MLGVIFPLVLKVYLSIMGYLLTTCGPENSVFLIQQRVWGRDETGETEKKWFS